MATVWRKASLYDPARASARTWIFAIARNLRVDALRRERRPQIDPRTPRWRPDAPASPETGLDRKPRSDPPAGLATRRWPPCRRNQAHLVELSFFQDAPHSVIAAELGLPLGTSSRVCASHRARAEGDRRRAMTARHHPGEEVLLGYASAILAEPLALVVATHLALCPDCRAAVDRLEALGGVLLERIGETGNVASLENAIDSRDRPRRAPAPTLPHRAVHATCRSAVPAAAARLCRRRSRSSRMEDLGAGIRPSRGRQQCGWRHGAVLSWRGRRDPGAHPSRRRDDLGAAGQLHAGGERFQRGDLSRLTKPSWITTRSRPEATCICLVVNEAPLKFRGMLGRLLQPLWRSRPRFSTFPPLRPQPF